jgi:hypothetical protein
MFLDANSQIRNMKRDLIGRVYQLMILIDTPLINCQLFLSINEIKRKIHLISFASDHNRALSYSLIINLYLNRANSRRFPSKTKLTHLSKQQLTQKRMLKFCVCKQAVQPTYETISYSKDPAVPSTLQRQIELNRSKLQDLSAMKRDLINGSRITDKPRFHSTRIEQPTVDFEEMPSQLEDSTIYSTMESSLFSSDSMFTNSTISSCSSEDSSVSVDVSQERICAVPCVAKLQGDLSLFVAERVRVLHANDDYAFVKKVDTNECGYVPTVCLTTAAGFIRTANFV